jgi:HSP20 family protein
MVSITRRDNPANLFGLQRLNRILDEAFGGLPFPEQGGNILTASWIPATDVSEDKDSIRISMELPGINPEDVRISLENNVLTIRGEKKQEAEENNERVHRIERIYGTFERTFVLPNTVDPDRIEAGFESGLLNVTIPKSERARPREIRVNASGSGATQVRTQKDSQPKSSGHQGGSSQRLNTSGTQAEEVPSGSRSQR